MNVDKNFIEGVVKYAYDNGLNEEEALEYAKLAEHKARMETDENYRQGFEEALTAILTA